MFVDDKQISTSKAHIVKHSGNKTLNLVWICKTFDLKVADMKEKKKNEMQ